MLMSSSQLNELFSKCSAIIYTTLVEEVTLGEVVEHRNNYDIVLE